MVDATEGVLGVEWIEGTSVRLLLGGGAEGEQEVVVSEYDSDTSEIEEDDEVDALLEYEVKLGASFEF